MTKIISLYGGPGIGKSTTAANLFVTLKNKGLNVELVTEYVKQWVWDNREPVMFDQFYFFAKQSRKEYSLFNKVDYIITDSPIAMCCYYSKLYGNQDENECFKMMLKTYFNRCKLENSEHVHYLLQRTKPYNEVGRFQKEERSIEMDKEIEDYLNEVGIDYKKVKDDELVKNFLIEKNFDLKKY